MNQYTRRFEKLSSFELLKIVKHKSDYEIEAQEAAVAELKNRQIPDDEMIQLAQQIEEENEKFQILVQRQRKLRNKVISIGNSLFELFNPNSGAPKPDQLISILAVLSGIMAVYQWYGVVPLFSYLVGNGLENMDISAFIFLIPLLVLTLGAFMSWKRKQMGWILLVVYYGHSALNSVGYLVFTWSLEPQENAMLDMFISHTPKIIGLLRIIFLIAIISVLFKSDILKVFKVDRLTLVGTIAIFVSISLLSMGPYLF